MARFDYHDFTQAYEQRLYDVTSLHAHNMGQLAVEHTGQLRGSYLGDIPGLFVVTAEKVGQQTVETQQNVLGTVTDAFRKLDDVVWGSDQDIFDEAVAKGQRNRTAADRLYLWRDSVSSSEAFKAMHLALEGFTLNALMSTIMYQPRYELDELLPAMLKKASSPTAADALHAAVDRYTLLMAQNESSAFTPQSFITMTGSRAGKPGLYAALDAKTLTQLLGEKSEILDVEHVYRLASSKQIGQYMMHLLRKQRGETYVGRDWGIRQESYDAMDSDGLSGFINGRVRMTPEEREKRQKERARKQEEERKIREAGRRQSKTDEENQQSDPDRAREEAMREARRKRDEERRRKAQELQAVNDALGAVHKNLESDPKMSDLNKKTILGTLHREKKEDISAVIHSVADMRKGGDLSDKEIYLEHRRRVDVPEGQKVDPIDEKHHQILLNMMCGKPSGKIPF